MITLDYAIPRLAKYCGAGKYPDDPSVVYDINDAIERLMNKPKLWSFTTRTLTMCAPNGQLTLPREVAKIIKARVNGRFSEVQSSWFEYLSGGPGLLEARNWSNNELVDRGFVCTQYDIPYGQAMQIAVVSDCAEDAGATILFRGYDETGREVRGSTLYGEYVPIMGGNQDTMWISKASFSSLISIQKPVTKGYVYISAIVPATGERYFLGSIHPDETNPTYRRYFANEVPVTTQAAGITADNLGDHMPTPYRIDAICKLQFVPATHCSDVLQIQNIGAIKMMLIALNLEDALKLDDAAKHEATAERLLGEQTATLENDETNIEIDSSFGGTSMMHEVI